MISRFLMPLVFAIIAFVTVLAMQVPPLNARFANPPSLHNGDALIHWVAFDECLAYVKTGRRPFKDSTHYGWLRRPLPEEKPYPAISVLPRERRKPHLNYEIVFQPGYELMWGVENMHGLDEPNLRICVFRFQASNQDTNGVENILISTKPDFFDRVTKRAKAEGLPHMPYPAPTDDRVFGTPSWYQFAKGTTGLRLVMVTKKDPQAGIQVTGIMTAGPADNRF